MSDKKIKYSKFLGSTFGNISFAAFFIAAVTGVFLAVVYDVNEPFDSLAILQITNPTGEFIRALHYWSAQIFLIFIVLHIWDHLRKSTETKVKKGVWLRLVLSLLAVFFVMLSGFILKADADSLQAKRILTTVFNDIPLIGKYISFSLLGAENDFQLVYVHHIATATIFIWLIIIEHAKIIWPQLKTTLNFTVPLLLLSFFFPAILHNPLDPIMKGPWYFLAMQELFHYFSSPLYVLFFFLLLLALFYSIPKTNGFYSSLSKKFILTVSIIYLILIIIGYFFRGENWEFTEPWNNQYFSTFTEPVFKRFDNYFTEYDTKIEIMKVRDEREACQYCHSGVQGFSPAHSPEAIGCASCHLGNPFTIDKNLAHSEMIKIPGNLSDAKLTCGNENCHPDISDRLPNSIMSTMSGVISVDKFTFDDADNLDELYNVNELKNDASDTHLKNLCASCHIGKEKKEYGKITQLSRGGGCNACHLNYSENSLSDLDSLKSGFLIKAHPSLSLEITDEHCFGCHSRSGRISTNYEGWHETQLSWKEIPDSGKYRLLEDERVFVFVEEDVHHQKGLACIDCHVSKEVMGDGNLYAHKEEQEIVACEDCHFQNEPSVVALDELDSESKKIVDVRKFNAKEFLTTKKRNAPLINTYKAATGEWKLKDKINGKEHPLNPPNFICAEGKAHDRLSCSSCHTAWAPQCVGCHTEFNPVRKGINHLTDEETKGAWEEAVGIFFAEAPTLGVIDGKIHPFVPGMILTINKNSYTKNGEEEIFKRLFAPASPHTISAKGRSCKSCHNNPLALGYGRGELKYNIKDGSGVWSFIPEYENDKHDGLPQDAWIGFLDEKSKGQATRENAGAFSVEEQKKILTVGACLVCHDENSDMILNTLSGFDETIKRLSTKCILPDWR